jgi:hypothetical protein
VKVCESLGGQGGGGSGAKVTVGLVRCGAVAD